MPNANFISSFISNCQTFYFIKNISYFTDYLIVLWGSSFPASFDKVSF